MIGTPKTRAGKSNVIDLFEAARRKERTNGTSLKQQRRPEDEEKPQLGTGALVNAFRKVLLLPQHRDPYFGSVGALLNTKYKLHHIQRLVDVVHAGADAERLGALISASINRIITQEETFILDLGHLRPDYMGFHFSRGNLVIRGDVGDKFCYSQSGGSVVLQGNAGNFAGWRMEGGMCVIEGNAGDYAAFRMRGGKFVVKGAYGPFACYEMNGGTFTGYSEGDHVGKHRTSGRVHMPQGRPHG